MTSRALIGKVLVGGALVLLALSAGFWFDAIPAPGGARPLLAGVLLVVAVLDGLLGLRWLGES